MASIHHTPRADERQLITRLRLSTVGFAVLTGVLAFGYFWIAWPFGSTTPPMSLGNLRPLVLNLTLPALPGSVVSWWLLVVLPRRSSGFAGCCAGLLTIVLAVLGFWVTEFVQTGMAPWQVIQLSLTDWLIGLVYVCVLPWGWGIVVVGTSGGIVYGTLVSLWTDTAPEGEPVPDG